MDSSLRTSSRLDAITAGWTGDTATARRILADADPAARASALAALQRLDDLSIGDLQSALDDPEPGVRRRALLVAAADGPKWASSVALIPLLSSDDSDVVETAAFCAGEFASVDDATLERLHQITTEHDEPICRESAAAALGAIGNPASLPTVLAACDDVATVRRRAVLALAAFDAPAAHARLVDLLDDRDWQVRQAAEDLTADRKPKTVGDRALSPAPDSVSNG